MTRLGVTKQRLFSLREVMNVIVDFYDKTHSMSRFALLEDKSFTKNLILAANQVESYLKNGNSGVGSIVKPTHRRIAVTVDLIIKEIGSLIEGATIGSIMSDDKTRESFIEVLKNKLDPSRIEQATHQVETMVFDLTFNGLRHLMEINELGTSIKDDVEKELKISSKKKS